MSQDHFNLVQSIHNNMTRLRKLEDKFNPKGRYHVQHLRSGLLMAEYPILNDITNEGKNLIFDTMFNAATQITTWYIGLIDNSGFTALAAGDIMTSHAGWVEFTGYSQANRVTWVSGASSSQTITNATPAQFDITAATATMNGIFISSNNTKGGTTGKLWSTGSFSATVPVVTGDQLKITYTLNA